MPTPIEVVIENRPFDDPRGRFKRIYVATAGGKDLVASFGNRADIRRAVRRWYPDAKISFRKV